MKSNVFKVEVYDCLGKVSFDTLIEDVNEETGNLPAFREVKAITFDANFCPIGEYGIKDEVIGVSID